MTKRQQAVTCHRFLPFNMEIPMPRAFKSLAERFHEKFIVNEENGCWEWQAYRDRKGYGWINDGNGRPGRPLRAHRVSHELFIGPIPEGMLVMHKCDNPRCVNPYHLKAGTAKENTLDMLQKKREQQGKQAVRDCIPAIFKMTAIHGTCDQFLSRWMPMSREHIRDIRTGNRLARYTKEYRHG